jgi:UDP-N-acetylmuramate dehydrogenase
MFESFNALINEPMSRHTTLRLGGPADYLVFPRSPEEIRAMFTEAGAYNVPVTVIGHGSNLLVLDGGIRGLVICIGKNMRKITRKGNTIIAQAGAMLGSVAVEAADAGLTGLEFASGIPGTVGGGVTMNAGAYDGEMAQVVTKVKGLYPGGETVTLSKEEMDFGYRHSAVTEKNLIVTEVTLELQEGNPAEIRAKMSELNARRAEKQPLDVPSAGSTFKRPEGYFAAALIDQCGLKGYSIGGARVSMKHAGFLVNTGTSSKDFLELMQKVQQIVEERAGVKLEPEIRVIGEAE